MAAAETLAGVRLVRRHRFELSESAFAYLLNVPAILTVLLLVAYPIVDAFWLSLHRYNLRRLRSADHLVLIFPGALLGVFALHPADTEKRRRHDDDDE